MPVRILMVCCLALGAVASAAPILPICADGYAQLRHGAEPLVFPELRAGQKQSSVTLSTGESVPLQIFGRSPAEGKFKAEEALIAQAGDNDLVPIEIGFSPYFRPLGHSTLRIGNSLYDKTAQGWYAREGGKESARAYYFNFPFAKSQLARFGEDRIAPFTIGVTVFARKADVVALREELRGQASAVGAERERFNLFSRNCNQGIVCRLAKLRETGVDAPNGFTGFSSVMTFRDLLEAQGRPGMPERTVSIYPLAGTNLTPEQVAEKFPPYLLDRRGTLGELGRIGREWVENFFYPAATGGAPAPEP